MHKSHERALEALSRRGRHRALATAVGADFASNDYLGLASSEALRDAALAALERGVPVGAGGSRLLRGNHREHEALEAEAAAFFGAESALFLGGGFLANVAIFSTLPQRGDLIVHDALIHASVHDGVRASKTERAEARHNDPQAFEDAIGDWRAAGGAGTPWIAVESLYSMDGDRAPLDDLMHKLMGQIAKRVGDKRLLKLIRAFLNAGVMENGLVSPSVEGTPQGGPLSPLLSNLVLDELDRELERRGHRFVRYADDCNIYVRSERAGQRVMESVTQFITQKLKLKVNEAKSAVARPQERKFLGFSFTAGPEVKRVIAPKALDRFKQRIREITRRAKGVSMKTTMEELAPYMRGWRSYFGFCETPEVLIHLTRWVRLRLRAALWRQWKTPRRRRAALLELGVRPRLASNTAGSGHGPWYLARAQALAFGLSNAYFKSLGLPSLFEEC